ncbi:MAG: hypothetical protein ACI91B_001210, partial [Planctomycetota bacterium]
ELHEPNGDRTITKIVKVNPNRAFTVKEQKNIFGVTKKLKSDSKAGEKDRESKKAKTNKAGAPR